MKKTSAYAIIRGLHNAPGVRGVARFTPVHDGTTVEIYAEGLPDAVSGGAECNPCDTYAADGRSVRIPVLFAENGRAHMTFYTGKFRPYDVIGKTVVIRNCNGEIAGGEIKYMRRSGQR